LLLIIIIARRLYDCGLSDTPLNAFGAFSFEVKLPDNVNLGDTSLELTASGWSHTHHFNVQEFRRPEFKAEAKVHSGACTLRDTMSAHH
jgi:hypothetical protein